MLLSSTMCGKRLSRLFAAVATAYCDGSSKGYKLCPVNSSSTTIADSLNGSVPGVSVLYGFDDMGSDGAGAPSPANGAVPTLLKVDNPFELGTTVCRSVLPPAAAVRGAAADTFVATMGAGDGLAAESADTFGLAAGADRTGVLGGDLVALTAGNPWLGEGVAVVFVPATSQQCLTIAPGN